jgi:ribosome-binding protein aMBF1 (putative translation factor)
VDWRRKLDRAVAAIERRDEAFAPFRAGDECGTIFREARRALGVTQEEMADRLLVNKAYLSRIECGHVSAGPDTVRRLGGVLKEAVA